MRKNIARRELDEGVKMLMTNNTASLSLQDLNEVSSAMTNGNSHYENVNNHHHHVHPNHQQSSSCQMNDYRKSMPNLQDFANGWHQSGSSNYQPAPETSSYQYPGDLTASSKSEMHLNHSNLVPKPYQPPAQTHHHHNNNVYSNMTRHALMQISAVPKPKLTNDWVQFRKSEPVKPSLNSHWLIQEAEQRRIEQMNNVRSNGTSGSCSKKPLPDSVIQTLTQRVQNMGLGVNVNKRWAILRWWLNEINLIRHLRDFIDEGNLLLSNYEIFIRFPSAHHSRGNHSNAYFSSSARKMINECLHCLHPSSIRATKDAEKLLKLVLNLLCSSFCSARYTIFDSKQMPSSAQPSSSAPLLMLSQNQQQPQPTSMMHNPLSPPPIPMLPSMDVLSVSSKKLCSYCNHELGSGAAMIIENLGLFYHINCFKCSVCQTPISDGNIHGTDVRVRNSRLHCHNCFSNEEGVKFSCVWLINLQASSPPRAK